MYRAQFPNYGDEIAGANTSIENHLVVLIGHQVGSPSVQSIDPGLMINNVATLMVRWLAASPNPSIWTP